MHALFRGAAAGGGRTASGGRTVSTLIVAVLISLVLSSPAQAAPPRVAPTFFGMNLGLEQLQLGQRDAAVEAVKSVGVRTAKLNVLWAAVQPYGPADTGNWASFDDQLTRMVRGGIEPLVLVGYGVRWAMSSSDRLNADVKNVSWNDQQFYRPQPHLFAEFARKVAERYGAGGQFWSLHPELPYRPATRYSIWNEPNMTWAYRPAPNPAEFGELFRQAAGAIRGQDPRARVFIGGLAPYMWDGTGYMAMTNFLDGMGVGGADGVAVHSYDPSLAGLLQPIVNLRAHLVSRGAPTLPIVVAEWGWATFPYGKGLSDSWSDAARPVLYRKFADLASRSNCGVDGIYAERWLNLDDGNHEAGWNQGLALSTDGLQPRWSARALGGVADKQAGAAPDAARATAFLCTLPPPDSDGDGVQDQHDYAPLDPAVRQAPTQSAPAPYETPVLSGDVVTGKTLKTTFGTWNGSPLPALTVARWEHCSILLLDCKPLAANGTSVTLPMETAGRVVRSVVRASNSLGQAEKASAATEIVQTPARFTVRPWLTGYNPGVGDWVVLHPGELISIPGLSILERRWERCNGYHSGCSALSVSGTAYQAKLSDYTKRIRVTYRIANKWGEDSVQFITEQIRL